MKKIDKVVMLLNQLDPKEIEQIKNHISSKLSYSNKNKDYEKLTTQELDFLSSIFRH
ncbi:hypothetical protein [Vibrio sp. MA40-2]|uniref:hypothetical protein n=1 Tax=Vibrio sp. MA40-2 TaxID=3391828 RepID=UPI0039A53B36